MRFTESQIRQRMTPQEKAAIEFAAADVPTDPEAKRLQAAAIRSLIKDLAADGAILNHDDPKLVEGFAALEAFGLLAPGRAAEILSLPAATHPPVGGYSLGQEVRIKAPLSAAYPDVYPIVGFGPNCVELPMGQFDLSHVEAA